MEKIFFKLIGVTFLLTYSFLCAAIDPMQASFVWKSDLNVGPKADFLIKTESTKIDDEMFGIVNDLKFYGEENNSLFLAYEEKNVGEVIGIFHLGQIDSPLITVTTRTGRFFDVRGYYYDEGKVKKGFEFSSVSFPEVVLRRSGGVYIIVKFYDENNNLMTKRFFYIEKNWANDTTQVEFSERLNRINRSSNF